MSYEDQFRATCDAEGLAPAWAIEQIFKEHSSSLTNYQEANPRNWENGELILEWLGY